MDSSKNVVETKSDDHLCKICGNFFSSRDSMETHKKRDHHDDGQDKKHKCSHCTYSSDDKSYLQRHLVVHNREKVHECFFCSKKFTDSWYLLVHTRSHIGLRPHSCCICSKKFATRFNLRIHGRVHTQEKPYECPHCDHKCSLKSAMKRHIIAKHTKQYSHHCPHCSRGFCRSDELKLPAEQTPPNITFTLN